jgi:hypothetical protein
MFLTSMHVRLAALAIMAAILTQARPVESADFTAREVTEALFKAGPERVLDFSGKDLSFLDLASTASISRARVSRARI